MQKATFPMHPAQRDIYVDQLINKDSPHYNLGGYIKLKGSLNKEKFFQTVNSAPYVFDVFNMRFDTENEGTDFYLNEGSADTGIVDIDFSGKKDSEQDAIRWMQNRFNTPFILKKENPLYEHSLLKISDKEHWFFGRYHHLITDGFGFIVFIQYVAQKYKSLTEGGEDEFNYPSYLEEISKSGEYLNSGTYSNDEKYWKEKISHRSEPLLQRKYIRKDKSVIDIGKYVLNIREEEKAELSEIEKTTDSGIQQLILAALLIYFGKTSKVKEPVIGVPVHKRGSKVLRNTVGMFSGVLPFRGVYEGDQTVKDILHFIKQAQRSDYRHQNYPLSEIKRNLKDKSSGDIQKENLFEVSLNYEPLNFSPDFGSEIKSEVIRLESDYDTGPLQLYWRDYGKENPVQFIVKYSREYFNETEAELFVKRILFVIKQLKENFSSELKRVRIIPPEEENLLEGFNGTVLLGKTEFNSVLLTDLIPDQVKNSPDNPALIFHDEELSYQELNTRSNRLANYLLLKGVKNEKLVPIIIERSLDMIIGIIGILKAGGVYVPIDPEYPADRISYMLQDTDASIILSSSKSSLKLHDNGNIENIILDDPETILKLKNQSSDNPKTDLKSENAAYVIYTSGSTGKPKGVIIENKTVVNLVRAQSEYFNITSADRILQFSNYSFDASVEQIFLALTNGATLVLFREGLQLDQEKFNEYLIEKKITHLHATPAFLENIVPDSSNFPDLKRVIAGGDVCKHELSDNWKDKVNFYNEYGPTETTVTAIEYQVRNDRKTFSNLTLPIGKPLSDIRVYIADNYNEICPVGVSGEICISGNCLARGYLNLPEITEEKFVNNPFIKSGKELMYRTGDLGRWMTDGNIEFLGRIDDQVKIRGYRIELGEIEAVILDSGLVKNSVVLSGTDSSGNNRLVAYVIPEHGYESDRIRNFLAKKLPEYMIPAVWVEMGSFPVTSNGKIDRKAFPDPQISETVNAEYQEAETEIEVKLSELWKEILKIEKVGINDNFFELGGHSLNAVRLSSRINKVLNVRTDIGTIFSNPTIYRLSKALEIEKSTQFPDIKKQPEKDLYELSHAQKRFWILSKFKDGSEAYNVSNLFEIKGKLNPDAFRSAFEEVVKKHEILRTVFIENRGEPYQKILSYESTGFEIFEKDLTGSENADAIIKEYREEDIKKAFDLKTGPLIRIYLFKISVEKHIVLFNIHHIISDGWSKEILINDFLSFYNSCCLKEENDIKPLPIQYKDYAEWHKSTFEEQGKYWKEVYKNGIPLLDFPADNERPEVLSYSGNKISGIVSEKLTSELQMMAVRNNVSLNNLMMILYGLSVAAGSGQEDVVIGTVSSGRSHPDLEDLVGVFINFLPVRISPEKHLKLSEFIGKCRNDIVGAFNNQDYPFDLMVEDIIKKRDVSRNPFFDTMMNFQIIDNLSEMKSNSETDKTHNEVIELKSYGSGNEDLFQSVLDFKLDAVPDDLRINLHLSYNTRLYSEKRMKEFLDDYIGLLENAVSKPDNYLSEYIKWSNENKKMETEININKESVQEKSTVASMPVNVCSSFVTEPVKEYMEYWSNEIGIKIKIDIAPYNQVFQQLMNPGSLLYSDKGINFLFIRTEDWLRDKKADNASEQIEFLDKTFKEFLEILKNAVEKIYIPFLVMIVPVNSITDKDFEKETVDHLDKINKELELFLNRISSVQFIDINVIKELYDVEDVYDPKTDELGHMPFTPEFYAALGTYMTRKVSAFMNPSYKVIALDCDNTLWKGICGEVGALNVEIDENYSELQEFFIEKYNEGFLLVLSSKNNEDDVWEVFDKHPGMKLKREHIAAHRINWEPKPQNLVSIAKELNLGINSFIFVDDNEFETDQMTQNCPDVLSLTLPGEDESFSEFLNHIWAFDYFRITDEDRKRNEMYKVEKQRKSEEENFGTLDDFLKSLEIKVDMKAPGPKDLERAVQLTLRTNQFNLNGVRKTPEEVKRYTGDENSICRIVDVKDRFGEYGIVGLVMGKVNGNILEIDTFLLSCRVLGRNVEGTILSELESYCVEKGLGEIKLYFQPTQKNKPFQEFLANSEWNIDTKTNAHSKNIKLTEETAV
ncbi:MAG TPA: amino acid adenylation domain-containing protein [Ignavibacteria bacterium]|nr:amino acid adenylation domain-containing protein [Ignavibacteria bacterium]